MLQATPAPLSDNLTNFLSDTGTLITQTKPHAFVNWVLFDNQFNYVAASSGFDQVGVDQLQKKHTLMNLPVSESGYCIFTRATRRRTLKCSLIIYR
jgi:hypothetical protein